MAIRAETTTPRQPPERLNRNHFEPGDLIGGRYRVVGSLRSGRLDEAYQVEDLATREPLALKVLRRARGTISPGRSLARTCRRLASLQHPNVARIRNLAVHVESQGEEEIESALFVTSDLVEGEPLGSYVRKERPLDRELARSLIEGICAGLEAVHRKRLVHGDLSGAAIILVGDGSSLRPVITDFALSASAGSGGPASIGSPVYRAPETIVGRTPDRMSDVFSLGAIIYEVLSGRIPFTGGNLLALDFRTLEEEPRPLRDLVEDLDPELERVVSRCLSRAPEDRYASAGEVRSAIRGMDSPTPRTRRNVSTLGSAAALVVVMFGGSALLDRVTELERRREWVGISAYRPSFAILDIAPAADTEPWMAAGLSELIRDDFSRDGSLRVAEHGLVREYAGPKAPLAGTPDAELASRIRNLFDVEAIVIGTCSVDRSAGMASVALDLCVIDARSGETIAAAFERGSPDSLPELAARAAARLRLSIGVPEGEPVSMSWDPDAVRPWATGLLLLQENRVRDALGALEEAAAIQPSNPRIHDEIMIAWSRIGSAPRAREAARRAVDLSRDDGIETMLERRATLALLEGDIARAIEEKSRLASAFPDRVSHAYSLIDTLLLTGATRPAGDEIRKLRTARATVDSRTEIMEARLQSRIGRYGDAVAHAERAIAIAKVSGSRTLRVEALIELARARAAGGDSASALAALDEAEASLDRSQDLSGLAGISTLRADLLRRQGELDAALEVYSRLRDWYGSTGQDQNWALALRQQAGILSLEGRHESARALLRQAVDRFVELGDDVNLVRSLGVSGGENLALGRLDEARETYTEAAELAGRRNLRALEGYARTGLARVAIEELDLEGADRQVAQALAIFGSISLRATTAGLDFVRADLDRLRGRIAQAENRLAGMATEGHERMERELQSEIHLSLANVTLSSGRNDSAEALALRALDYYAAAGNVDRQAECLTVAYVAATRRGNELSRTAIATRLDRLAPRVESPVRRLRIRLARASSLEAAKATSERLAVHARSKELGLDLVRLEAAAELRSSAPSRRERQRWEAEVSELARKSGAAVFIAYPD